MNGHFFQMFKSMYFFVLSSGHKMPKSMYFHVLSSVRLFIQTVHSLIISSLLTVFYLIPVYSPVCLMMCRLRGLMDWGSCSSAACRSISAPVSRFFT